MSLPLENHLADYSQKSSVSNRRLALGGAVMAGVNVAKLVIQFAMLPIMARLLGPSAFGLYALALPTVAFVLMLADGGLGNSLAREELSAKTVWSSAFWAVHGFAILLALGVIAWSFLLAALVHQPRLPALMSALAISLIFLAASVLPTARMMRQGRLHVWSIADLSATLLGAAVGITLALKGAGTWALVGQYVTAFAARAVVMNAAAFELPSFTFDFRVLHTHLLLGGSIVGSKLADYFGRMVENSLVSAMLGASSLGVYGFANQVPRFLCESGSNPIWSIVYVQAVQKPHDAVIRAYYQLSRALAIVMFPCTILAAVASPEIIHLFLGPAWRAAGLPLAIILPSFTFATILPLTSALLYADGKGGAQLWITASFSIGRALAAVTAGWLGLVGVAVLIATVNVVCGIISAVAPARAVGTSPKILLSYLAVPFCCAVAAGAACLGLLHFFGVKLLVLIPVELFCLAAYVALFAALERKRLIADIQTLRGLLRRKTG